MYIPCSTCQKTINDARLQRAILEFLQKRRFVESDTGRKGLVDDPLAFRDEFRSESVGGGAAKEALG